MKPQKIDDSALIREEIEEEIALEPGRIDAASVQKEIDRREREKLGIVQKLLKRIRSVGFVSLLFVLIVLTGTLYDTLFRANAMMQQSPILGSLYLLLILLLSGLLGYGLLHEYLGYRRLKRIERLQEEGERLLKKPGKGVYSYARRLLSFYKKRPKQAQYAKELEAELEEMLEQEVLPRLDEKLLAPMDERAKKSIVKYASQTAVSTAISPVALIDAFLILSRSYAMIREIAEIYGYRPNFVGEIVLIKRVFLNLAFASVTDILAHHSHDILGSTLLSKISLYSAQGVANGILTARVGLGTIAACRPIPAKMKNEGFLKNLTKIIIDRIFLHKGEKE